MKRQIATAMGLLIVALIGVGCGHYLPSHGWVTLIDGNTGLDNGNRTGSEANWRAEDGSIQADKTTTKGASVLVSKQSFKDFEFYAEFWAAHDTNSGIYIRAMNPTAVSTATDAYEAQIWDKNPNPAYSTGNLVKKTGDRPLFSARENGGLSPVFHARSKK